MSDECCGPARPAATTRTPLAFSPPPAPDGEPCCGPATASQPAEDGDACCGSTAPAPIGEPLEVERSTPWWRDRSLLLPVTAGVLWVAGLLIDWANFELAALVVHVLALLAGAWTFVPGTLRRLVQGRGRGRLGVGLLMTIAASGAVLLGHVGEAAALAFLFSLAEALEDRSMDRAKQGLRALLALMPETARVRRPDGPRTVPAAEVSAGDVLLLGAGDRVATDGVVETGRSWVDTSAITGESIPVEVGPGDEVHAGSVNGSGSISLRATADGRDNSLTQIVRLVDQAHAAKGERARLADRIARPLVPTVLVVAVLVALVGVVTGDPMTWVERALVVLVAASPCALAIAVPVTVISSIGSASKLGVVIKSGAAFEQLGTIRTVALDKTGTLTRNQPCVVDVAVTEGHSDLDVLAIAAALESVSTHPLATAILTAASGSSVQADDVQEIPGHGITGTIRGGVVRAGSPRWITPGALGDQTRDMASQGMSVVMVEEDSQVIGAIGIRDELRADAAEAVAALHAQGIRTVMLTGDNELTARAIAAEAGIDEVHAEQLPTDKASHIRHLTAQSPTAMIGDGINDAPALASASVGIAMGVTGTAAAVESADVAFTGTDLRQLPAALAHARRGRRIMTGNIGLALAIIVVLFPLALFGVLGLAAVVLVHEVAEVVVIANGMRAARAEGVHSQGTPSRAGQDNRETPPTREAAECAAAQN
ncbi:cation-translocating P-type ATPase [Brachybacterium paraconglomeratum]|jgi:cation-transporting P-type ATPase G|uniref:heavy metal translocating P-type ATPase n=2 Tax=Dermabacteraceae TaxID=85020 RepID=UPI001EF9FB9B|nr:MULTISPECIES: cation-translocating P-type ATPase [Brachybacterium]MCT1437913.1 cadmium-translocating P-type ATPase [Brachybacterium paraconglomeratum]MCZ4328062.1 cation-translocating P-type ATPase [Brachybacterium paraconglomeratum]WME24121.1 cation-translocating P-type ATPase [Brachybacterium sp. GU-2]